MSRPDIINKLPNGSTEEIYSCKHPRADGSQSVVRKILDANGDTVEVWHEVRSRDGTIVHEAHLKFRRQESAS